MTFSPPTAHIEEIVMNNEFEQGSLVRTRRRHNGYFAGDFSNRPFPSEQQLHLLVSMRVPALVSAGG
jgi:hypothetical protein